MIKSCPNNNRRLTHGPPESIPMLWRCWYYLFIFSLAFLSCEQNKRGQRCKAHEDCRVLSGVTQHCIRAIGKDEGFRCQRSCSREQKQGICPQGEVCIQRDCIAPDPSCWGICQKEQLQSCPPCAKTESCQKGRCVPFTSCTKRPDRPLGLADAMGIFDSRRRRIVIFGGDMFAAAYCTGEHHPIGNATLWMYDTRCANFQRLPDRRGPHSRARGLAMYDHENDRMLLYGGQYGDGTLSTQQLFNDVWALDLKTLRWREIESHRSKPQARGSTAGAYDPEGKAIVIFGGNSAVHWFRFSALDDLWLLELNTHTWRELKPAGDKPAARLFHTAAFDTRGRRLFIYGGANGGSWRPPYFGDLWMLDIKKQSWLLLHDGARDAPVGRIWSKLAYEQKKDRLLLFGGHDGGNPGQRNDTWSFGLKNRTLDRVDPRQDAKG